MDRIIKDYKIIKGIPKITFDKSAIYNLIKEKFGFKYTQINGKKYFLKKTKNDEYEIIDFYFIEQAFGNYIKDEFYKHKISKETNYINFINEYYKKSPLKNSHKLRKLISEKINLKAENLHKILLKIDIDYKIQYENSLMIKFLSKENFKKMTDIVGNFKKDADFYYKELSKNEFLIINNPYGAYKKRQVYDLWKVKTKSLKTILEKKINNITLIQLGFDIQRDIKIYQDIVN